MPAQTAPADSQQSASIGKSPEKNYSPGGRDISHDAQPWWMWWGLFVVVAGILYCRQPQAIRHACYFGEDGKVFFRQQYENGFVTSLFTYWNQYLHFAPRIVAGLCSFLPLEYNPTAYAIISLLTAAAVITFFFAAGFRSVIKSDLLRAIVVLTFTMMPNSESLMRLAYICWYLVFFVTLLTIYEMPRKPLARWLLFVPAALAAWSAPQAIVCLPLALWRAWLARERDERVWWILFASALIGFLFTTQGGGSSLSDTLHQHAWSQSLRHAIGFRVFCYFFLGQDLAQNMPATSWIEVGRLSRLLLAICVLGVALAVRRPRLKDWRSLAPMMVLYLLLASPAMFVLRAKWVPDFLGYNGATWYAHGRYFFTATLLLCVLSGLVFERVILPRIRATWVLGVTVILFCFWLDLHAGSFVLPNWEAEHPWQYDARQIRAAEARVLQSGGSETIHIKTIFEPSDFDLVITPATAAHDSIGRPAG